jgi:hypothetical protein
VSLDDHVVAVDDPPVDEIVERMWQDVHCTE